MRETLALDASGLASSERARTQRRQSRDRPGRHPDTRRKHTSHQTYIGSVAIISLSTLFSLAGRHSGLACHSCTQSGELDAQERAFLFSRQGQAQEGSARICAVTACIDYYLRLDGLLSMLYCCVCVCVCVCVCHPPAHCIPCFVLPLSGLPACRFSAAPGIGEWYRSATHCLLPLLEPHIDYGSS